jgi:hypothetical protein
VTTPPALPLRITKDIPPFLRDEIMQVRGIRREDYEGTNTHETLQRHVSSVCAIWGGGQGC